MWGRCTPLVVMEGAEMAIRYRNDILRPIVQPYRQNFGKKFVLMDDSSRTHGAHLVNKFLHDNIARLEWPASSPELCSFSNLSVASLTSQLILQPFRRFTYVTAHSPTLPLLRLSHSSFSNPSFASPTSQALQLIHLASRPCPTSS